MAETTDALRDSSARTTGRSPGCKHLEDRSDPPASSSGCEECLKTGMRWVHLRLCLTCGHVGCCNASEGQHATAHFEDTGHPVIRSHEPGESWCWCYADEVEP